MSKDADTRQILNELLEWKERTGGWDAACWQRARQYRDSLFPSEASPPPLKTYEVVGTIHLADGFAFEIKAESTEKAKAEAKRLSRRAWPDASVQEVCIDSVTEITND